MSDPSDPNAWIARAEEDYTMARSALRRKRPLAYSACFHAQQCAEKCLKALLVEQSCAFPKTHDLLVLSELCQTIGITVPTSARQLHILSDYAVWTRYPGEDPTVEDAQEAVNIAREVRRFARHYLAARQ
jgi:HEPN domain-containing protein